MRYAYPRAESREADQAAQRDTNEATLIDRASSAVARRAAAMLGSVYGAHVIVLAGSGHNGADALWAGLKLRQRGARVDVVLAGQPRDEHGAEPLRRLRSGGTRDVPSSSMRDCDLVIDGLVGLGFTGSLRTPQLAEDANTAPLVLAVDIPSGVDADTGAVEGAAVRADVTVTFGALKTGLIVDPGAGYAGAVEVADVGLTVHFPADGVRVMDADDVASALPEPPRDSSKYSRGVVGVVAGSEQYTGAAALCAGAALRAGAGMVHLLSTPTALSAARSAWPELVFFDVGQHADLVRNDKIDAWVVGSGMGSDDGARDALRSVLGSDRPVIVDADALTLVASDPSLLVRSAPTVLTPHLGEFVRLTGVTAHVVRRDRIGAARDAAVSLGVTVLLKGTTTVIAEPDGTTYLNPTGTPWLATAGTGDVLSGVIGTLLAKGLQVGVAAAAGAWLHGLAGLLTAAPDGGGAGPLTASQVLANLPAAIRVTAGRRG